MPHKPPVAGRRHYYLNLWGSKKLLRQLTERQWKLLTWQDLRLTELVHEYQLGMLHIS